MQDKLKESISKSEHLAELFAEREGAAIFLKWARIPRRKKYSQEGTNPKELGSFPRHLVFVELYCSVHSIRYNSGIDFEKKNLGTIFEEK